MALRPAVLLAAIALGFVFAAPTQAPAKAPKPLPHGKSRAVQAPGTVTPESKAPDQAQIRFRTRNPHAVAKLKSKAAKRYAKHARRQGRARASGVSDGSEFGPGPNAVVSGGINFEGIFGTNFTPPDTT